MDLASLIFFSALTFFSSELELSDYNALPRASRKIRIVNNIGRNAFFYINNKTKLLST